MAVKCALTGGVAGLLLGVVTVLTTPSEGETGVLSVVSAALQVIVWCFVGALAGGGFGYVGVWLAERKLGLGPIIEQPDLILQKTSYLRGLLTETQKSSLDIGTHVVQAQKHLDAAEKEFAEGAFAPFWDEIEHAANQLAAYKNEVEHMQRNVSVYNNEANELLRLGGDAVAPLALVENQLPDARPSAARFMSVVRKAQTNFEFAMIFEQRKTNQLLHTGFGTLGSAIHSLGESINASLDKLSRSLDTNTERMLSYQSPVRHAVSKMMARDKKPDETAERLVRYDPTRTE